MDLSPTERFHGYVQHVATGFRYFEHRSHREAGTCMSVVLDDDIGVLLFDGSHDDAQHMRTADTCHILEAYLLRSTGDELLSEVDVILGVVYFRIGDTHGCLGCHACLFRPFDGRNDITRIVQTAEDTGDVGSLRMLHFVHQLAHICRHGVHTQRVQTTVEHMGLDTRLVEGFAERTYRMVRVLAVEQVHLFRSATVGLHAIKTAHVDDDGCHACQLVFTRHIPSATLPHVAVDKGELNFFFHYITI